MRPTSATALALLCLPLAQLLAQEPGDSTSLPPAIDARSDSIDVARLALIGGLTTAAFLYGHVLQSEMWWKGERSAFHFEWRHDWSYALGADKLGHAWFPYVTAHTYDRLLRWAGVDTATSIWTASSLALGYQTYIEIRDGYSADWGFSWGDAVANTIGAALPIGQHYLRPLRLFDFKMSFWPSEKFRAGSNRAIIDDYESSYHWLTLHVVDVLPAGWRELYPGFVDVALGHGVKNLDGAGGGTHEIFVALDWNLDRLPGDWWGWNLLREIVRHYHLPSPSLRLYPGPISMGLRF